MLCLKHGSRSLKSMSVKTSKKKLRVPFIWATDRHSSLFFHHISDATAPTRKEEARIKRIKGDLYD